MTARPPLAPPAPPCAEAPHGHAPRRRPAASAEAFERAAAIFRAAGDVPRLRLLERLGEGECCVTELATEAGEALSTVSQRLRVLRAEGLITRRREGKHIYYALADAHVAEMIHNALEHAHEPASGRAPSHSSAAGGPTAPRPATDDDHDGAATSDAGPGAPRPAPPATKPAKRRPTRKVQAP
ncbi:MAG TPA: metalloregulator ArsR/SmtB family transcription factor [Polyangiaceae bacterium]|nr:metalloregulator ArsR/SmtB family transcription factor [Polyangiaceae bacterium]